MSFVNAAPDRLVAAARNLAGIGSTLSASNATAAAPTLAVSAAASDQVSAAVAAFFSGHARGYQTLSAQAAKFHTEFVQALSAGANSYASAEAANSSPLQQLLNATPDTAPVNDEAVTASTEAPATTSTVPVSAGQTRGSIAGSRAGAATEPAGAVVADSMGSSTESATSCGSCGNGGLLLRAGGLSAPGGGLSASATRAGASGGLLNRLLGAEGANHRTGAGARNGVWLDGIRGAAVTIGPNRGGAAGGASGRGWVGAGWTPVFRRGSGAAADVGPSTGASGSCGS
ncbi:PE family protein [Mycobacterium camsae]|uniref:PE family protein n=1 Tax=Mycobacterium gordonae TaxID=1778 RepID=UPI0019819118|nr:PE family protein [Mycobacterium gordonae]